MKIKQLSPSGYQLSNILDLALLTEITQLVDTFTPIAVRETLDRPDLPCPPIGARREVFAVDGNLRTRLLEYFSEIKNLDVTASASDVGIVELWRDYPGYTNEMHYDNSIVKNVLIIYIDGIGQKSMGTVYHENDNVYSISYEKDCGLFLLNSDKILHGMGGSVSDVAYRKVLYINWIHKIAE